MVGLRRLHRLKQGLPEGSFPNATDRPIGKCDCRAPPNEFFRCLPGLPSDIPNCRRPRKNCFCHPSWKLSLQGDALRLEECRVDHFISRSADRCRPFFLLLHKWKGFEWTEECALTFQQLKEYLAQPSIMSSPDADEMLFAYIAVASHVVSLVLIREDNGTQ